MNTAKLHVIRPGLFTLVQDAGRNGWQQYGVPSGGALDKTAMQVANWLVGNPLGNPVLEITLTGPEIEVEGHCLAAISGADMSPSVNGSPAPMHRSVALKQGDKIAFGKCKTGCRAYLSVGGKWLLPQWLGSSGAAVFAGKEILPGSLVKKGATLEVVPNLLKGNRTMPAGILPNHLHSDPIRVLPGPEFEQFPRSYIALFFGQTFRLSNESNRMGCRLEGDVGKYANPVEMITSGTVPGTIQIANGGQPIVLLADAQTTGGYPRLANVISADLDTLAQKRPGDPVNFQMVDLETAITALKQKEISLSFLHN